MPGTNVGSVFFDIIGNQKPFNSAISKAANHGQAVMGSAMKKVGGLVAGAFSVAAVISFGKACIKTASEAESAFMGLKSILQGTGKSVSTAQGFLKDFTADGLVPMTNAVQAYKNLAARGYDTTQIEQVMSRLKDSAAFGRAAAYSYGDAITSATEGLKNENSILVDNAGVTKNVAKMWEDYAKKVGKATTALTQQEKVQAEVAGIIAETKWQLGDAAKYADTFAGRQARLSATLTSVKTGIGNIAMAGLNQFMPVFQKMADATVVLINRLTAMLAGFGLKIPDVTSSVSDVGNAAATAAGQTEAIGDAAAKAAKKSKKAFAGFDEINVLNTGKDDASGGAADTGADIGAAATSALTTTTGAAQQTASAFDGVLAKLKEMGGIFKDGFDVGFGTVDWAGIKNHITGIGDSLKNIFTDERVVDAGKVFGEKLLYNLGRVVGSVASIGVTIVENLLGGIDNYLEQNKDRLENHLVRLFDIGGRISDIYGDWYTAIADIFSVFRSDAAKQVTADIIGIFVEAKLGIIETVGTLGADLLQMITGPIVANSEQIKRILQGMFEPLHVVLDTIKQAIQHTFDEFQRVHQEKIKPAVDKITGALSGMLQTLLDAYEKWVAPMVSRIANGIKDLYENHIKGFITSVLEIAGSIAEFIAMAFEKWIKPAFDWIVKTIVPIVVPIFEYLWNTVKNVFGFIIDTVKNVIDFFRGFVDFITGVFSGNFEKAVGGLKTMFEAPFNQMKAVLNLFKNQLNAFKDFVKGISDGIKDALIAAVDFIVDKFRTAWENIKNFFSGAGEFFKGVWAGIKESLTNIGQKIGDAIGGTFRKAVNAVMGTIESTLNAPIHAINNLIEVINAVPGINLGYLNTLSLPRLAQGGYVNARNPQLAIIGDNTREGEIVAPESKIADAVRRGISEAIAGKYGQAVQDFTITLLIKGEDGRQIIKKINAAQMNAGQILLEV
jgi:phage-related protein